MTDDLTEAWQEAIAELRADRELRVVAVTGAGKAFCAGGELSWLAESATMTPDQLQYANAGLLSQLVGNPDVGRALIAALNGPAVGAGLAMALACDLRYATPEVGLSMPFTSLGIHPGMAATFLLPEVVGLVVTRDVSHRSRTARRGRARSAWSIRSIPPTTYAPRSYRSRRPSPRARRSPPG